MRAPLSLLRAAIACWCCSFWCDAADQRVRVCGRELTETLRLVCKERGGFNDPSPADLHAVRRGGVADECCWQGCTMKTLQSYCKFDEVVQPRARGDEDDDGCVIDDDEDEDDELFSLQLLHRANSWCGSWQPAGPAPPDGEVECACSRGGGGGQLENVVRKGPRQHRRQRPRPPPRQPSRQPQTTPATRRPVVRGTVTPYFAGRPVAVVLPPPQSQRQPANP